ncbi:hypothetical protein F2Q70_00021221 [Brassica cretica]|uniref:Uncharacterized protein n=1 Tax=Brassica cretica TaxID=69181 RepID=A0A8S9GPK3_BRACR|nr:hypothetical protein F2Q70_00021221 [Brassica cretica]
MLTHKLRLDPTNMGETKILVEVELDKPFPKLIALDDKQGNIYLVDVEYSWIPSGCERCGALGHKEKRCLLPPKPLGSAAVIKENHDTNEELSTVDIVLLLQNTPSTHVNHLEPNSQSPSAHRVHETPKNSSVTAHPEDATSDPITHSHEVHSTSCSKLGTTLPMLAATIVAPSQSQIMEEISSQVNILEVSHASENEQPIGRHSPITQNHHHFHMEPESPLAYGKETGVDVVGETSSYNLTRGGRPIKPTQKFQDMEWTNVSGRGKKGRRGRGNHLH